MPDFFVKNFGLDKGKAAVAPSPAGIEKFQKRG